MSVSKKGEPLWVVGDDKHRTPVATRPFVFYCGCSRIKTRMYRMLDELGYRYTVDYVKISASPTARRFVELNHLVDKMPRLGQHEYSVAINPDLSMVDIQDGEYEDTKQKVAEVLKGL